MSSAKFDIWCVRPAQLKIRPPVYPASPGCLPAISLVRRSMSASISLVDSPTVVLIASVVSPTLLPFPTMLSGSVGISIMSYV